MELKRCTQVLVNNGYANSTIEEEIRKRMDRFFNNQEDRRDQENVIKLYYRNYMNTAYRMDEKVLCEIIKRGVTPIEAKQKSTLKYTTKTVKHPTSSSRTT